MTEQLSFIEALSGLQAGDLVAHRLATGLRGQIVTIKDGRATLRLLTWPTTWLRRWYRDKPMAALTCNLVLAE